MKNLIFAISIIIMVFLSACAESGSNGLAQSNNIFANASYQAPTNITTWIPQQ